MEVMGKRTDMLPHRAQGARWSSSLFSRPPTPSPSCPEAGKSSSLGVGVGQQVQHRTSMRLGRAQTLRGGRTGSVPQDWVDVRPLAPPATRGQVTSSHGTRPSRTRAAPGLPREHLCSTWTQLENRGLCH